MDRALNALVAVSFACAAVLFISLVVLGCFALAPVVWVVDKCR